MHLSLEVKKYHQHFWLRAIHRVRIDKCCTGCFIGTKDMRVFNATRYKSYVLVDLEIEDDPQAVAYYLCGISAGCKWENNTHIAFIPALGEKLEFNDEQCGVIITDARQIDFQSYQPNPEGDYTPQQRTCRNWIFANYIRDDMLRR